MSAPNLLERVRKLLAQAEDPGVTAQEAEAFNAKAAELIARHGIDAALLAATGRTRDEVGHRAIVVDNPYARDKAHLLTSRRRSAALPDRAHRGRRPVRGAGVRIRRGPGAGGAALHLASAAGHAGDGARPA